MAELSISVKNLSKSFHIYERPYDRLRQLFAAKAHPLIGSSPKKYYREFVALNDVSFDVMKGETIGVVGSNGSGKSTLLQLICGTLTPSSGEVLTNGRIAALLELGSGFNPEFSGRENVILNASILGLSDAEIADRFDSILDFAEIGDFIDQPVKTYSSGMLVRLAFSVAINVAPQILVVDEALAVGDELFQRKCFTQIEKLKKSGTTILFVSHSGATVIDLCDRAVLLDAGEMLAQGSPKSIIGKYQKLLYASTDKRPIVRQEIQRVEQDKHHQQPNPTLKQATIDKVSEDTFDEPYFDPDLTSSSVINYTPQGALISRPEIVTLEGKQVNCLLSGRDYFFRYQVNFTESARDVSFGMLIKSTTGVEVGGYTSGVSGSTTLLTAQKGDKVQVEFRFTCRLNQGTFFLNAGVQGKNSQTEAFMHRILDIQLFKIIPKPMNLVTGLVDFNPNVEMNFLSE